MTEILEVVLFLSSLMLIVETCQATKSQLKGEMRHGTIINFVIYIVFCPFSFFLNIFSFYLMPQTKSFNDFFYYYGDSLMNVYDISKISPYGTPPSQEIDCAILQCDLLRDNI